MARSKKRSSKRSVSKQQFKLDNCIVFCSRPLNDVPESLIESASRAFIVAVDGGLGNALDLNIQPSIWVGDGDSLPKKNVLESMHGFPKVRLPKSKDYSDLEFALNVAEQSYFSGVWDGDVILLGAQGGRFDHDVINMIVAQNWLREMAEKVGPKRCPEVVSIGEHGVWIATMREAKFRQPAGRVFSVFTLDADLRVTITGAKYNVKGKKLGCGALGLSNVGLGKDVKITAAGTTGAAGPVFVVFPG